MSGSNPRFAGVVFLIVGALLIWIATFTFAYVFAALACARGFADGRIFGLPVVPTVTSAACLFAAASIALIVRKGYAIARTGADERMRFSGFTAMATGCLSFVALVLLSLPPVLVGACIR